MNLIQIVGSVIAVGAVIAAVRLLGLGRAVLDGPDDACAQAEAMVHDFTARDAVVCGAGNGALVAGCADDFVVLKRLGSHYAARRLVPPIVARADGVVALHIASGDRFFGRVELTFADSATRDAWRARIDDASRGTPG